MKEEHQINAFLKQSISELLKIDEDSFKITTDLGVVGMDSLSAVMLCGLIEEQFDIEVDPLEMFELRTIREVCDAIHPTINSAR